MNPYTTIGGTLGAGAGAGAGGALGRAGSLLDLLKPLDYPREAAYNLVRGIGRGLSGEGTWDDLLGAVPGAAGLLGGALIGGPFGALAGAGIAGGLQGLGHLAVTGSPAFEANTPADLVENMGGDRDSVLQTIAAGVATDPLTYVGGFGGAHGGAKAGAGVAGMLDAAEAARPALAMDEVPRVLEQVRPYMDVPGGELRRFGESAIKLGVPMEEVEGAALAGRTARNQDLANQILQSPGNQAQNELIDRTLGLGEFAPRTPPGLPPPGTSSYDRAHKMFNYTTGIRDDALEEGNKAALAGLQPRAERLLRLVESMDMPPVGQPMEFQKAGPLMGQLDRMGADAGAAVRRLEEQVGKMAPEDVMATLKTILRGAGEGRMNLRVPRGGGGTPQALVDVISDLTHPLYMRLQEELPDLLRLGGIDPEQIAIAAAEGERGQTALDLLLNQLPVGLEGTGAEEVMARQLMAELAERQPQVAEMLMQRTEPMREAEELSNFLQRRIINEENPRIAAKYRASQAADFAKRVMGEEGARIQNNFPRTAQELPATLRGAGLDPGSVVTEYERGAPLMLEDMLRQHLAGLRPLDVEEQQLFQQVLGRLAQANTPAATELRQMLLRPKNYTSYFPEDFINPYYEAGVALP